ncbi:transketolase [Clostridium frigidicarnis]|uniref:Transketolase n=1 Tax=Clostridium frigidicarnis TaxID=84698 RepID=A0A1I0ZXH5_9CLOT|nr:transketolase [Clostridium frigidicarnis]SFB29018.1 transketolase [Clostridium frigidicarnis]
MNIDKLKEISKELRKDIIEMIYNSGSGHPGGSLSAIDIITYLYFEKMNIDPKNPKMDNRDRFVLSKGHAAPALYAALAKKGYIKKDELNNLRKIGSILQGHPDSKKCPGVDISTGSLGQGFSNAGGLALANKIDNKSGNIYVLLGDGEIQEGIVWEVAMSSVQFNLDNLVAIIDKNGIQLDGRTSEIMNVDPLKERWQSFGWNVIECNGHDFEDIEMAFSDSKKVENKPTMIIANTVKGKGISFMEDNVEWHGVAPSLKQKNNAILELSK